MSKAIKEGSMVQVWDWADVGTDTQLTSHGRIGYVVKKQHNAVDSKDAAQWKVVFFDRNTAEYCSINEDWLQVVNSSKDIREVDTDGL